MNKVLLVMLLSFPVGLFGQGVDSVALKMVDSLIQVSRDLTKLREFDKAMETNEVAETIALKKWGEESVGFGNACHNHGVILLLNGKHSEAEGWLLKGKTIREKKLGKSNQYYANSLYYLGYLYDDIGNYEIAEKMLLECKDVREKVLKKMHSDYCTVLNDLGILYYHMMNFEKAEKYYVESNNCAIEYSGKLNYDFTNSLHNLAQLNSVMGDFENAEPRYIEAIAILEQVEGKNNASYAQYINNLGGLYKKIGEYKKAEHFYLEALSIRESIFGKMNPRYAKSLNSLANLYHFIGENEKAEPLLIQAIEVYKQTQEKPDLTYASCFLNLGGVYVDLKNYGKAEGLLKKSRDVMEEVLGKEHPYYTWSLMYLGKLYSETGKYEQAEELFLASKSILEKSLGKNNLFYEECLDQLALMYWASKRFDKAAENIRDGLNIEKDMLADLSNYSSERGLAAFISNFKGRRDRDLSFVQIHPSLFATCYDNTLFHKGFLLNAASQVNKLALSNPTATDKYNQLKSYHRRLAAEYAKPIAERKNVAELEEKANGAEKELAHSVAGFGEALRQVTWQEVQQNLRPGEAAIEFVHYKFINPKPTDSTMYAALVLLPDATQPAFIPLFEEKQLDALLQSNGKPKPDFVNGLYASGNAKNSLYSLLWQPLEQVLSEAQTVYFSPSGLLHRLNLGAIAMPPLLRGEEANMTLADRYRLVELGSTRQLVVPHPAFIPDGTALLYGGLEYEMDTTATPSAISTLGENPLATRRGLDFANVDSTPTLMSGRGGKWGYLRWTDVEVDATEAILADAGLRPTVRKGHEGTEESFKAIGINGPSPRVLHLATHGFFFPDPKERGEGRGMRDGEPVFKASEHPMIRAGLVLADGNYAWKNGKIYRPDGEDGILTAYEISQMNLSNTELVVLSACETGLGDIQGNEGVYGLQRAFKIAGAKYLIMSLWQVPDFQTQELMTSFYSLWLEDKMPIPDAFRAAQKAMREKYKSPFLWAGFVLVE